MSFVISGDGTRITYDKAGRGAPLILIDGALCSRKNGPNGALAALLSQYFTVYTYDRRGRGESGDSAPYQVEREVEDLGAIIEEAVGSAYVYGISSGAALALEAAVRLDSIKKLALYEAPFVIDGSRQPVPDEYTAQMERLIALERRGAAVKHFMRKGVGLPAPIVAIMPLMPTWPKLKEVAHTLLYDTLLTIDYQKGQAAPLYRWAGVKVPALVAVGGKSPAWMRNAMKALADVLPDARHQTIEGQTHIIKSTVLAPVLHRYFAE
ncbi:hydrolase [Gordoniibacillus kamchatkensis]|uniref:Hydrolase n=1 Tax=Gordoniibacillus kamchatkensis TaxID=1590651 RepID=A0ABR5AAQ8_9BACL|nr:alpha/beta hydrolase [Paenibacillus sp. VKM B-2647]KIL38131.1 hydrolase [Paenibacillus sp. VKM B-2647]